METLKLVIYIMSIIVAVIGTFIPMFKSRRNAVKGKDTASAINDMTDYLFECIEKAEKMYNGIDAILKQQTGKGSGENKKDGVIGKLQAYAINHGYNFDLDYWNEKIDRIISMTKTVNKN